MKIKTLATSLACSFAFYGNAFSQTPSVSTIDYGMTAASIFSPAGTVLVGGGFQLMGTVGSFNPANASLGDILNSSNMLTVNASFTSIDIANPGQFYKAGILSDWSTGVNVPSGKQLYVLASASSTFDSASPWALITGSNSSWLAPDPGNPGSTAIELSFLNNSVVAAGFGGPGVGAYFGSSGNTISAGDANLTLVPEPSTYALMALGGLVLFFIVRRRKAQQV
jgi:hypothetical protein